jgi:hypothetical protein
MGKCVNVERFKSWATSVGVDDFISKSIKIEK